MKLAFLFLFGLSLWQVEAATVAIPASQTACTAKVTFPVKVSTYDSFLPTLVVVVAGPRPSPVMGCP